MCTMVTKIAFLFTVVVPLVIGKNTTTQMYTVNLPIEIRPVTTSDDSQDEKLTRLEEKVTQIQQTVNRILMLLNGTEDSVEHSPSCLLHSCEEIKAIWPDSHSDYYTIADSAGHVRHVYCNMEELCEDSKGGWMRVAYLNMSDSTEDCPQGFRLYEENGIRACGRQSGPGCQSVKFSSYNISYSQVCGRVIGYQKGSTDGIAGRSTSNLNAAYVDGVSLTRGNPRQHIWTFIAALQENFFYTNGQHECPCAPNSPVTTQSFVGDDYFCESGEPSRYSHDHNTLYTADPLWDGEQCGLIEKACCNVTGIPWFNKVLQQPTTDYIELRVCGDSSVNDEDVPVGFYEIYVK